jgi:hypothetical protein
VVSRTSTRPAADATSTRFERYWRHVAAPDDGPEEKITERLALAQIWPHLRPVHREALAALAAHGDYQRAAQALGLPYATFKSRISTARREFLALWHDGETPSRPWVRDRRAGPGTDMHTITYFLRSRRLRRTPQATGSGLPTA